MRTAASLAVPTGRVQRGPVREVSDGVLTVTLGEDDRHRTLDRVDAEATDAAVQPYVALTPGHLRRWRGHALARFGHPDAVDVLRDALASHDSAFSCAEAGLHADRQPR